MALIIGAEGEGVSRLVLEESDYKVSLPMRGGVGSLNASVAAGILMYAAMNTRA
jgi:23S rRNA (guanosine2251-2'-O)-methyltransferase